MVEINFKNNLHLIWKNSGLKQKDFCKELEIPYNTFHKYLSGDRIPDLFKQKAILEKAKNITKE